MKSILMSIKPKWVEKIASGEKTVEVRKFVPKCGTPFKCYIYCTKGKPCLVKFKKDALPLYCYSYKVAKETHEDILWNGKVVGEFVCDKIIEAPTSFISPDTVNIAMRSRLTVKDLVEYGKGAPIYGLHISDLKIYDKPKELREFRKPQCIYGEGNEQCTLCEKSGYNEDMRLNCYNTITRPPQSWCYVEEL